MTYQKGNKCALKWTSAQIQKLCDDATSYYNEAKQRTVIDVIISQSDNHTTTKQSPPDYPSIHEFQLDYDYSNYIFELEKQHESVSECLTRIRRLQAVFLQRYGLSGLYSAPMAKMGAMNNKELNWTDKSEVETNQPNQIIIRMSGNKNKTDEQDNNECT